MKKCVLGLRPKLCVQRGQLKGVELIERPSVGIGDFLQFFVRFRKGYIEACLAAPYSLQQELQRERRFADTWVALKEVNPVTRQSTAQDRVQTGHAGNASRRIFVILLGHM